MLEYCLGNENKEVGRDNTDGLSYQETPRMAGHLRDDRAVAVNLRDAPSERVGDWSIAKYHSSTGKRIADTSTA